jgi:hypothetical protein
MEFSCRARHKIDQWYRFQYILIRLRSLELDYGFFHSGRIMGAEILVKWQHSVPELALPMAGGRDPVGRPQRRPQQRDGNTAHKERHKEQRASLEVHPGLVSSSRAIVSAFSPHFHAQHEAQTANKGPAQRIT